jgi:Asp-tRNAAsn/Glu-tRNAGln amidotransferase A subunit and related amidases
MDMGRFRVAEATISQVHQAMEEGMLTCRELTEAYLQRIEAYDKKGPGINAIITVNPQALSEAEAMDEILQKTGKLAGPLHGIPVLLKDNINTCRMVTTAGSLSMAGFVPEKDAFITKRLKQAGAVILAKTNLHEFAIWGETISSVLGQTLNPYDLTRTPGGSSGGTGAAVACNMGMVGIGTDTINSIRSPSSACSLVGIRPTMGLVSRNGIVPYSLTQDTAGPICRTVEDAARVLDVIAGYDPSDRETAWGVERRPVSYVNSLKPDGARGRRIGVLESFFGKEETNQPVNHVMEKALNVLRDCGAVLIPVREKLDSAWLTREVSVHLDDFKTHLNQYLEELGPVAPVHSLEEILKSGKYHPGVEENMRTAMGLFVGTAQYNEKKLRQREIGTKVLKIMADYELDAMVYPHQQQLVCKTGSAQQQRNGVLCSVTGFPSIAIPAGFAPDENAPVGVPVGMEIMGRPFSEDILIEIACGFESAFHCRKEPVLIPGE